MVGGGRGSIPHNQTTFKRPGSRFGMKLESLNADT